MTTSETITRDELAHALVHVDHPVSGRHHCPDCEEKAGRLFAWVLARREPAGEDEAPAVSRKSRTGIQWGIAYRDQDPALAQVAEYGDEMSAAAALCWFGDGYVVNREVTAGQWRRVKSGSEEEAGRD